MASVDYKQKYKDIRSKLVEASDVAFRLGFEEGVKEGTQQAQQQQQEQEMMVQQQQMQAEAGMEGEQPEQMGGVPPEGGLEEEMPPEEMGGEEAGSELDQHIGELENMVAKGEKPKILDIRKIVESLSDVRKSQKNKFQKKTDKVISKQKSLVDGILKKWEGEVKDVTENLEEIIQEHGIELES